MATRAFISRFSPNRTDPRVLEAIFVQRHKLVEVWLERLRDSVLTGVKHHLLAIGPRGCGKSHLVNLLVHRLQKDAAVVERICIARLPEDETTPSFWKFLLRILRALNASYGDEFPPPPRDELDSASDERRSAVLSDYVLEKLHGRTLLVVVENLDDVMRGLGAEGQKRWRAFLQENSVAATLATAQQLTEDISDRDRPFFNFFQIEHLQPLWVDEALSLLQKLADHNQNTDLSAFLKTPTGRARVRAIRHIAGGSHRVFIILSEFVTRESLDDLVSSFEELLDELTPYYQERLRWLPNQQREIIEFLCRQNRTVQVKAIAAELYLSEQSVAAQLKSLKDKGYVTMQSVGRESRYELAEPMMRLCVEVKDTTRAPIRLIVEFLRVWYDRPGVEARLRCLPLEAELERQYLRAAVESFGLNVPSPVETAFRHDLIAAAASGNLDEVGKTFDDAAAVVGLPCEFLPSPGNFPEAAKSRAAFFYAAYGISLAKVSKYKLAVTLLEKAIELWQDWPQVWRVKAWALTRLGRFQEALVASDRGIALGSDNGDGTAAQLREIRGIANLGLERPHEAIGDFCQAIGLDPSRADAFKRLAEAYILDGNWGEAEQTLSKLFQFALSPTGPADSHIVSGIIAAIFRSSTERSVWIERTTRLTEIAAGANALPELSVSLIESLTCWPDANAPEEAIGAWTGTWDEIAKQHSNLSFATRLFGVGARYLQTKDERVLLDLVQEERSILRNLFGLDGATDRSTNTTDADRD